MRPLVAMPRVSFECRAFGILSGNQRIPGRELHSGKRNRGNWRSCKPLSGGSRSSTDHLPEPPSSRKSNGCDYSSRPGRISLTHTRRGRGGMLSLPAAPRPDAGGLPVVAGVHRSRCSRRVELPVQLAGALGAGQAAGIVQEEARRAGTARGTGAGTFHPRALCQAQPRARAPLLVALFS